MKTKNSKLDRWIWINLVLRLLSVAYVLLFKHWSFGDTSHYLNTAQIVCGGEWGQCFGKPPLYSWYLCALSPFIGLNPTAAQLVFPLVLQTLFVWGVGVWFYKKFFSRTAETGSKKIFLAFWFFDPVLLVYSLAVMSDAFFAAHVLLFAYGMYRLWIAKQTKTNLDSSFFIGMGVLAGLLLLNRAIAAPFIYFSVLVYVLTFFKNRKFLRKILWSVAVALLFVSPLLYWNHSRLGKWTLSTQGDIYLFSVAAIVKHNHLEFTAAEKKWFTEEPNAYDPQHARQSILQNFSSWAKLSAKGVARVWIGHVNVEWGRVVTGKGVIGPSWFKAKEKGAVEGGGAMYLWLIGVLLTAAYCLLVYFQTAKELWKYKKVDWFSLWIMGSAFLFSFSPQVWGDARFRASLWPLIIILWLHLRRQNHRA